jgi:hypothetical protein
MDGQRQRHEQKTCISAATSWALGWGQGGLVVFGLRWRRIVRGGVVNWLMVSRLSADFD